MQTTTIVEHLHSEKSADFYRQISIPNSVSDYINLNAAYTAMFKGIPSRTEAYFRGRIWADWKSIERYMPRRASATILDIGSGVGGISLILADHYADTDITLVDKSRRQGFDVRNLGVSLLKCNHSNTAIRGVEPASETIQDKRYDLIVSFRALGYMFPYLCYADLIRNQLKKRGTLILDISTRRDDGSDIIRDRFGNNSGRYMRDVFDELNRDIGKPKIVHKGHDYCRVHVVKSVQ